MSGILVEKHCTKQLTTPFERSLGINLCSILYELSNLKMRPLAIYKPVKEGERGLKLMLLKLCL